MIFKKGAAFATESKCTGDNMSTLFYLVDSGMIYPADEQATAVIDGMTDGTIEDDDNLMHFVAEATNVAESGENYKFVYYDNYWYVIVDNGTADLIMLRQRYLADKLTKEAEDLGLYG